MFVLNQDLIDKARITLQSWDHLFWVLGGSCSGKTTICRMLAGEKGLPLLDMDSLIFGDYMSLYRAERHPANKSWFSAPNPLAWALSLSWEEFKAMSRAADGEYLDLLSDSLAADDGDQTLIVDGGLSHPAVLAQAIPARQIVCLATSDDMRRQAWETAEERAAMKGWIRDLANPDQMWEKFLFFDKMIAEVMAQECRENGIDIFYWDEGTTVKELAGLVAAHFAW